MQYIASLFLLLSFVVKGGDWDDYYFLLRKHREVKQLNGSVVTRYFYEGNKTALKTERGSFVIDGAQKYVNYQGHLLVQNEKYNVTVDKDNKVVMVNHAPKAEEDGLLKDAGAFGRDSARFRNSVTLTNTKSDKTSKTYELSFKDAGKQYEKIILEFSPQTGLVRKVTYLFRKAAQYKSNPTKVEIEYTSLSVGQPAPKGTFEEAQIARIKGKDIKLVKAYGDYKVIDYRNIQQYAE